MTSPGEQAASDRAGTQSGLIRWLAARSGSRAAEIRRFVKFALIGALATVIDFVMLNVLQATILPPQDEQEQLFVVLATSAAYCTGLVANFTLNRLWTYPESRPRRLWLQMMQFLTVYLIALAIRALIVSTTYPLWATGVQAVLPDIGEVGANRFGTNLAQLTATGVTLFWNFFLNRYWTFGDVER